MNTRILNQDLDNLERDTAMVFSQLLEQQEEFVIFAEEDLEHDSPDDYLEMRNDITGNVFDVHPLKVTKRGIEVIETDGGDRRHIIGLSDLSSIQDRINLCSLMENLLN
ncbi:hypothetical protein E6Q11_04885 [Candidatus Dojkabacteria bacterium]|uniref:Uncharacterized protein n=1 Tax=Candidatus Dojkabacteria bacterium TaxID=2099670 RepID=A0A5C7J487_9BACT|nr:MAG: hypothetical protein E6Q11_04885 [Candidatus Dojkabacteria bacterium]